MFSHNKVSQVYHLLEFFSIVFLHYFTDREKGQLQNQFVYSKIFTVYLLFIAVDVCLLNTCGNEIIITFGNIL